MTKKDVLKNEYYMVSMENLDKKLLKAGQKVYLRDNFPASCLKLYPNILKHLDTVGKLKKDGKEYTANWVEIEFEEEEKTIPDSYLDVLFEY